MPEDYSPAELRAMADAHDRWSVCTMPAREHFAEVCRLLADRIEADA